MMVDFNPSAEGFVDLFGPSGPSGVYLLLRGAEVLYVGQSENVLQRVASHRRAQLRKRRPQRSGTYVSFSRYDLRAIEIPFDSVKVLWCSVIQMDRVERELILRLQPRYNRRVVEAREPLPDIKISLEELGLGYLKRPMPIVRRRVA